MKFEIMKKAGNLLGKTKLGVKRHEPEILVGAGLISGAAAIYATIKGTLKSVETKTAAEEILSKINEVKEEADMSDEKTEYTEEVYQNDLKIARRNYVIGVTRNYIPAAAFSITSAALILAGIGVLKKRNAALSVAYSGLANSYSEYRKRVEAKYGKEAEEELYRGKTTEIQEEIVTDPATGEETAVVTGATTAEDLLSPYARKFAKGTTPYWKESAQYVLWLINLVETECNKLLDARGYVFLNEAYDKLGFERTLAGQQVGWLKKGDGDGHISLGVTKEQVSSFLNGETKALWLDPNVDGPILDKADCLDRV